LNQAPETAEELISAGIARLRALHEGDRAVLDLISCGPAAVEPLRAFLFTREPGGLFQARCQAVKVLAALGARDALLDFLVQARQVADPVEEAGEEAVTNAVARALAGWPDEEVFAALLAAAASRLLPGIVDALGEFPREEIMPLFAAALADDFCRPAGQKAFRRLGEGACPYLLKLADCRIPSPDEECESSRRLRRSALDLFGELYRGRDLPGLVCSLIADEDAQVAAKACALCLPRVSPAEGRMVAVRLIALLADCDLVLRADIEDVLVENYAVCRSVIEGSLAKIDGPALASLRRVLGRVGGS